MEYKHFSHHHNLKIHPARPQDGLHCSGCESPISAGSAYACFECKYFLHEPCGNAARGMQHRSHPLHHLTLVPHSTYPAGNFLCKACGEPGKAFSFCCPLCDFDLHAQSALFPEVVKHEAHPHNLALAYDAALGFFQFSLLNQFVCSICRKFIDSKVRTYDCYLCNYHIHASCAFKEADQPRKASFGTMSAPSWQQNTVQNDKTGVSGTSQGTTATTEPQHILYVGSGTGQNNANIAADARVTPDAAAGSGQNQSPQAQVDDPVLRQQLELQQIQLQLDMSAQLANMMASFNPSSFM